MIILFFYLIFLVIIYKYFFFSLFLLAVYVGCGYLYIECTHLSVINKYISKINYKNNCFMVPIKFSNLLFLFKPLHQYSIKCFSNNSSFFLYNFCKTFSGLHKLLMPINRSSLQFSECLTVPCMYPFSSISLYPIQPFVWIIEPSNTLTTYNDLIYYRYYN